MKTKFSYLALTLLISTAFIYSANSVEVEYEDGVAVLTEDNFQDVIDDNEFVLVKFYAPWCGHCKKLKPEYIGAAELYYGEEAETEVVFGDVDATENGELASQFGVTGYPTMKFFVNGIAIDYNGGRDEEGIIDWIEEKILPSTSEVASLDDLETAMEANKVLCLFFGAEDSAKAQTVELVGKNFDKVTFFTSTSDEIATEFQLEEDSFTMLKQFDEGRNDFTGEFTFQELSDFVDAHRYATVMEFDSDAADLIFGKGGTKMAMFVFADFDEEDGQKALAAM
jgi:protein disulfide-isomerase A1